MDCCINASVSNGIIDAYRHDVHAVRNFQEQINVAARMRDWLEGSTLTTR